MRMFFRSALALGLLIGAAGCNSEDSVLTPGNPDDEDFELFMEGFDDIDGFTGDVVGETMSGVDAIMSTPVGGAPAIADASAQNFQWNATDEKWEGGWTFENSAQEMITVSSDIQFWEGATAVQYPNEANLTTILTATTMEASTQVATASAQHEMAIGWGAQTLTMNGEVQASMSFAVSEGATDCSGSSAYSAVITDVVLSREGGVDVCPASGAIAYTGSMEAACTGEFASSVSGSWEVGQTFNGTTTTIRVVRGRRVWTVTDDCGSPGAAGRTVSRW